MGTSKGKKTIIFFTHRLICFTLSGPPGPNLGADVVENRDIPSVSNLCQPEVEVRKVDQDDQIRSLPVQGLLQYPEGLEDRSGSWEGLL